MLSKITSDNLEIPGRQHSPRLVSILTAACDEGAISRNEIAAAADFSYTSAQRVVEGGWRDYDQIQSLIDHAPECVALEIAGDLCRRFKVSARDADGRGVGITEALAVAGDGVELAEEVSAADLDRVRTAEERGRIQRKINEIRARLDRLEAANNLAPARRVG